MTRYVMKYNKGGEKIQHIIYARTLISAKAQAREIAKKNDVGIMYGLEHIGR